MRPSIAFVVLFLASCLAPQLLAQSNSGWQSPPEPIASLVVAEGPPAVELSPCRRFLLLVQSEALPGIDVLARPHKKMAGSRIDPRTRGPQLGTKVLRIELRELVSGACARSRCPRGT
jgi:hypothetical protein